MTWTNEELTRIGAEDELEIASRRGDGTLRRPRTIWVVRHGEDLFVRSVNGPDAAWYRGTRDRHEGHITAGGVDKDVTFVDAEPALNDTLDAVYRSKYRRYSAAPVDRITSDEARATTIQLVPSLSIRRTYPPHTDTPTLGASLALLSDLSRGPEARVR